MTDIIKPTSDHRIYNPDGALQEMEREQFRAPLSAAAEILRESADLLLRCAQSSPHELVDLVAIVHFFRAAIAAADGCFIALKAGGGEQALVHARATLEASLYLQWLLNGDQDAHATQFYVWCLRQDRTWFARVLKNSPERARYAQAWADLGVPAPEHDAEAAERQVAIINQELAKTKFASVDQEFAQVAEKSAKRGRPKEPNWYSVGKDAKPTIGALARALRRGMEYDIAYRYLSYSAHSSRLGASVHRGADDIFLEHIRVPRQFSIAYVTTFSNLLRAAMLICERYRAGEVPAFARKAHAQWLPHLKSWLTIEMPSDTADTSQ